ncbi:MAG: hypothetical protein AAFU71_01105, partial [Cyanobacteria bacterium J06632_22]
MLETLSLAAATAIAKVVLDKFFEGAGEKLEETASNLGSAAVTKAHEKIQQLGQLVWQRCFSGKGQDVEQLPEAAATNEAEQEKMAEYLKKVLGQEDEFADEVKHLAEEIHQVIFEMEDINARNVQQVMGGQALQV